VLGYLKFDRRLKERAMIKTNDRAIFYYKVQKRYLVPIKLLIVLIYIIVIPMFEAPDWCLGKIQYPVPFVLNCEKADPDVPYFT